MGRLYNILHAIAQRACIETGTSDNWTYKKYADGTFEAWYTGSITTEITAHPSAWPAGVYRSTAGVTINYPSFVTSISHSAITLVRSTAAVWVYELGDTDGHITFFALAFQQYNNATYTARCYITGTWA